MATTFRATVMLVVLVGLPATWVYYGPLPPAAMGVIQRTILSAKQSFGWINQQPPTYWSHELQKTAPRFDASLAQGAAELQLPAPEAGLPTPIQPVRQDSQFMLASATVPVAQPQPAKRVDGVLAQKLQPHLQLLRSLDATEYTLENWGGEGKLYRFRCQVSWGESDDHTRQFEAVEADPLQAVQQVVGEVTSWQNARHLDGAVRWQ